MMERELTDYQKNEFISRCFGVYIFKVILVWENEPFFLGSPILFL